MLPSFTEALLSRDDPRFALSAVGIDARSHAQGMDGIHALLKQLRQHGITCETIFLEAQDETLIKRYSETRRKHPLSDGDHPLAEAIRMERQLLMPFLHAADLRIDTTHTNLYELRDIIRDRVGEHRSGELSLLFQSFGFKHGVPNDTDFVYDARCLPNPHWQPSLRPLTGRDQPVIEFLQEHQQVQAMKEDICGFLERWIPCFEADGRSYLTVGVGCTGGQHRSVFLVEQLAQHFRNCGRKIVTRHRELS